MTSLALVPPLMLTHIDKGPHWAATMSVEELRNQINGNLTGLLVYPRELQQKGRSLHKIWR